jgi:hypothetical protein
MTFTLTILRTFSRDPKSPWSGRRPGTARRCGAALAVTAVLATAACSSSGSSSGSPSSSAPASGSASGSASAAPASTTSGSASGGAALTKAEFITQADALCSSIKTKLAAVPDPASGTDYTGLENKVEVTLSLFPPYIAQVKALANRSPDAAEINTKWIDVEVADYQAAGPLYAQLATAAQAKNAAAVGDLVTQLGSLPDHSTQLASFMTSYGLTDCASLESS